MVSFRDRTAWHSLHRGARVTVRLHMPQSGIAPSLLELKFLVQIDFSTQVTVLERRERFGMATSERLGLRSLVSDKSTFGSDLGEAHEVVLQGLVANKTTLFLELICAEGFEFGILEAAVEGGQGRRGLFYFRCGGGTRAGGW